MDTMNSSDSSRSLSTPRSRLRSMPWEELMAREGEEEQASALTVSLPRVLPAQSRSAAENPQWKISPTQWPTLLQRIEQGTPLRELAQEYDVTWATIRRVEQVGRRLFDLPDRPPVEQWKIPRALWPDI